MEYGETKVTVYQFIINYIKKNGYPPTMREICVGCYLTSTASAYYQLQKLEEDGWIETKKGCPRAIKVVGWKFVEE